MKICNIIPISFDEFLLLPLSKQWQKIIPALQFEVKIDRQNRLVLTSTTLIEKGLRK